MVATSSRLLCVALSLLLVITPVSWAQQTSPNVAPSSPNVTSVRPSIAPVPPQITAAHAIFVSNGGGTNYFDMFTGGSDRAYNSFYADLARSSHYQLVSAPAQADLIFEIRADAPAVSSGNDVVSYNPQLILSILDPQTRTVLWTTRANVRAAGTKKGRDRGFDQSMAVLVDKLAQVTGQPLTSEQVKEVKDNSRMPTAEKVFITVGIAAMVGMATYGIYRVTHPPTLQPLTLPPPPVFPGVR